MTILHLIDNSIFKEQSFECIGNFSNKDVFTRKLISNCLYSKLTSKAHPLGLNGAGEGGKGIH